MARNIFHLITKFNVRQITCLFEQAVALKELQLLLAAPTTQSGYTHECLNLYAINAITDRYFKCVFIAVYT